MFDRQGMWRVTAGAALALGLLASSALAQLAPTAPPTPPAAPDPMPPNGEPATAPVALAPVLAAYKAVGADRLTKPDDGDWLMFRRAYDGWGYSPLDQITTANASHLHPVWSMATGQVEGHQAPPIVNNGVMFVATPGNQVLAINAKTGDLLWRFKRPIPEDQFLLHPTSRGVGLWADKVFFSASDATLVATQGPARRSGTPR
jgi:alcohol dehydrogenase (cytochrome c)